MLLLRRRIAVVALLAAFLLVLSGCADDSAGPEAGADVEDITNEGGVEPAGDEPVEEETTAGDTAPEAAGDEDVIEPGPGDEPDALAVTDLAPEFDQYVGEQVTVSGSVSEVISDVAFRIGGDDVGGEGLLIVGSPDEIPDVSLDTVAQVTGTVREFDAGEFGDEFGFVLDPGVYEPYAGNKAIAASSVEILQTDPEEQDAQN